MNKYGFELNFKKGTLVINGGEIIIHKDISLPGRSEVIIEASLEEGKIIDDVVLFEPKHHYLKVGRGIVAGKALVRAGKSMPIKFSDMNCFPSSIKKGGPSLASVSPFHL